jgi:aminoglycoside/choline kinase family phosphotransferase
MTDRVEAFLAQHNWATATRSPVAAGASTRILTRLVKTDGSRALLMDTGGVERALPKTPYEQTIMPDLKPFARVDRILRTLGMSAPEIFAESADGHFLLVEDFGESELLRLMQNGADPLPLLTLAVDGLLELQRRFAAQKPDMSGLRHYTPDFFLSHLAVIPEVYMPLLCGHAPSAEVRQEFDSLWRSALTRACATPTSLMLRDFSISNSFWLKDRTGTETLGLVDFETAGTGPMIYDLAAMLRYDRFRIPPDAIDSCRQHFLRALPQLDPVEFEAAWHIFIAMRQVQWAGSCSLYTTQGRQGFLKNLPGIWNIIEDVSQHPVLAGLRGWFDRHIPPEARRAREAA